MTKQKLSNLSGVTQLAGGSGQPSWSHQETAGWRLLLPSAILSILREHLVNSRQIKVLRIQFRTELVLDEWHR